jgi:hypothetical protein
MKKLILICAISTITFFAKAQSGKPAENNFATYSQAMNKKVNAAINAKDNKQVIAMLTAWTDHYTQLAADSMKKYKDYMPSLYYYLTSFTAATGDKTNAANWFEKAANAGYTDYPQLAADTALLDTMQNNKKFEATLLRIREKGDFNYILKKSGSYDHKSESLPAFYYQPATSPELVAFKNKFNLDSVGGNGDEITRIKSLLFWVHNVVRHDGNIGNPTSKNAADLIAICKKENRGLNCRMMATILKDTYQAEGFNSRIVTCSPKDTTDFDCHVITVVWSRSLNKWIWMDPTFNAYVSDDKGNLLSIEEVRAKLINGDKLVLNNDANWNNQEKQTKAHYLDYYMSKNLYWLQCPVKSEWDLESNKSSKSSIDYVNLYPGTYTTINTTKKITADRIEYATNNPDYFWKKPAENSLANKKD